MLFRSYCAVAAIAATDGYAEPIQSSLGVSFGQDLPGPKDAEFYRRHASPVSGPIETSKAGRWVLETDLKTRLAFPRLISLVDGASVARANASLQMIHGRILRTEWMYRRELLRLPLFRNYEEFNAALWLDPVRVAYLSTRFVAAVAIGGQITEGNATPVHVLAAGIDIRQGAIFSVASCQSNSNKPFFTFGSLLTICDDRRLDAFQALRLEQARIVQDTVPYRAKTPGDGKVVGFGRIDGREVGVISNDFTVLGASSAVVNQKKVKHVKSVANKRGFPMVFLGETSGARMPDRMGATGRSIVGGDGAEYQRLDRKSTRLNSSHVSESRMPSSA